MTKSGRAARVTDLARLLPALGLAAACGGSRPETLGLANSRLAPCPPTPNCVGSDDADPRHATRPFRLAVDPAEAWVLLEDALAGTPRTVVVSRTGEYLHAEATSLVLRVVDDLEFHLRPARGLIAVRSASRLGRYDLGVNRRRVERIRARLRDAGAVAD